MKVKHVLSLSSLEPDDISHLVDHSLSIAKHVDGTTRFLDGKVVGLYFQKPSTRTRTAFTVGALRLGARTITYGPEDLQIATGETYQDTGRVLSEFLDVLVMRSNGVLVEMQDLASQDKMAVINAMSENEHPTQAIADLATIKETLGRLDDIHVLYIGEGNNSAAALARAISKTRGMQLTLVTPEGYGLPAKDLEEACTVATGNGTRITQTYDLNKLPKGVDVVYTTRWQTMGVPKADVNWRDKFDPYRVTQELMAHVSKPRGTIFLHDLPAVRSAEVVDEVLDGPASFAFRQAFHKLTSAMAILTWCLNHD